MAVLGNFTDGLIAQINVSLDTVSANSTSEQNVNVPGLELGDFVYINKPTAQAGLGVVNCRVSAKNTLSITYMNTTASAISITVEDYLLLVLKSETPKRENAVN